MLIRLLTQSKVRFGGQQLKFLCSLCLSSFDYSTTSSVIQYRVSLEAEYEPNNTVKTPTQLSTHTPSPQSSPRAELDTSSTSIGLNNPQQRPISSRYIIGRPNETTCSPDKSFIENFNDAMKILQSISPPKISMTFQREYEVQDRSKRPSKHAKEENNNKPGTPQTSSERNAQQISQIPLNENDPKSSNQSQKDAAEDIKNI